MTEQTGVAKTIDIADEEAQYDSCAKKLLSNRLILAWILKECVLEFKQFSISRIANHCIEGEPQVSEIAVDQDELDYLEEIADKTIEGINTEDNSVKEGKVLYDIKFSAVVPDTKEPVQLIINVEAQKSDKTSYPLIKRAIYYVSRMISAQKNTVFTKRHYEKIRKVYSIWIQMKVDKDKRNTITSYEIAENQIVGNIQENVSDYDLLRILMIRLGSADEAGEQSILRLLDVLLSTNTQPEEKKEILERDFDIPMTASMSEEANIMCNLGEGIREEAEFNSTTKSIISVMDSLNVDIERAMEILKLNPKDYDSYRENVDEMLSVK